VAGLGLVFLLFACNLTVTEGTLNGLIFYANIVWINRSIYFPAMALLLDYRSVSADEHHKGRRMGCILNLLVGCSFSGSILGYTGMFWGILWCTGVYWVY